MLAAKCLQHFMLRRFAVLGRVRRWLLKLGLDISREMRLAGSAKCRYVISRHREGALTRRAGFVTELSHKPCLKAPYFDTRIGAEREDQDGPTRGD